MKLNTWLDISSKYIEDFCVNFSVAVGIFSGRLTDTSCQDFSDVKTDVKNILLKSIFVQNLTTIFYIYIFLLLYVSFACYELVGFCV